MVVYGYTVQQIFNFEKTQEQVSENFMNSGPLTSNLGLVLFFYKKILVRFGLLSPSADTHDYMTFIHGKLSPILLL